MKMTDFRKDLCDTEGGRDKLLMLENIVRDIWNNPKLNREDILYIAFILHRKSEGL